MTTTAELEALNESLGFVRQIPSDVPSRVIREFRARPAMCHSGGIVQGGFVTGWIDSAMAYAIIEMTNRSKLSLSLELKISFFQPAGPGLVRAEAWVEKLGRSTAFVEGRLLNEAGEVLAKGSSTMRLVEPKPEG